MNLQVALIALGIILIAAIYLLSRWQEGRRSNGRLNKPSRTESAEPSLDDDASGTRAPAAMESVEEGEGLAGSGRQDSVREVSMERERVGSAVDVPDAGDAEPVVFQDPGDPSDGYARQHDAPGEDDHRATDPDLGTGDVGGFGEEESEDDAAPEDGVDPEQGSGAQRRFQEPDVDLQPAPGFEKLSQIDYYVKLSGGRDVSRDSVLAVYREAAAGISKEHSVYGLRLPDKIWSDVEHEPEEARFGDLVMTLQLADSNGPILPEDMTRFSSLVVKLSESTGRGFSFMAPMESAQQQAIAIDNLRRRFDSIFVINIRPVEEDFFDGAAVDRCASQIGLIPDDSGFYARYKPVDKQKVCLYSLANMTDTGRFDIKNMRGTRTRGVTFFTRPAVNCLPGAVFSEMVDAAKAFASRIKGEAIAPGYDVLSNDNIEAIRRSIEHVASEMESYGIVPGSQEAIRLF
ncbi:MAG: hypothetical protein OXS40_16715 [Gammaproteobacteria bacterium]|nr:hypothetical protein [Gammaproteobacteria bacterium]